MGKLLEFLVRECLFLFDMHKCRIIDSKALESFGNAAITLEHGPVRLSFTRDRGQFFLILLPIPKNRKTRSEWYPLGLVRLLLTGDHAGSEMHESNVGFLKDEFDRIVDLFSKENLRETRAQLHALENQQEG